MLVMSVLPAFDPSWGQLVELAKTSGIPSLAARPAFVFDALGLMAANVW